MYQPLRIMTDSLAIQYDAVIESDDLPMKGESFTGEITYRTNTSLDGLQNLTFKVLDVFFLRAVSDKLNMFLVRSESHIFLVYQKH